MPAGAVSLDPRKSHEVQRFLDRCKTQESALHEGKTHYWPTVVHHHHYHDDSIWFWIYMLDPARRSSAYQSDADKTYSRNVMAVLFGAAVLLGSACLFGKVVAQDHYSAGKNMREDKRILRLARRANSSSESALKRKIERLARKQLELDTSKYYETASYFYSLTFTICSASALLVGGILSSSLLITAGAIVCVASMALGLFSWSFYSTSDCYQKQIRHENAREASSLRNYGWVPARVLMGFRPGSPESEDLCAL